jgi:DNA polymerase III subunit delta'
MKYNWSIIGHEKQLEMIEADIESGNLAHAYLLTGTNSIGKSTVAKKMAGILQCENDFCHKCPACVQVLNGSHIDTTEVNDDGTSIKIDQIRKLAEHLSMSRQGRYKIVLMQTIERMTIEAANSFLNILEEPPPKTIFLMTTDNVRALLPTITSRVRIVKFQGVSVGFLKEKLGQLYPNSDPEVIEHASLLSLGKTGKAVHLMENPDSLANYTKTYHDIRLFLERENVPDRFEYVEGLVAEPERIESFLDILTHVLRSKLLDGSMGRRRCVNTISKIGETAMLLRKNVNSRLALENLMLSL